jgi:hypothetical protein
MNYGGHTPASTGDVTGRDFLEAVGGAESSRRVTVTEWLHEDLLKRAGLLGGTMSDASETLPGHTAESANVHPLYS